MNKTDLKQLALAAISASSAPSLDFSYDGQQYSVEALNGTLRAELNTLANTPAAYRRNKNLVFELIEEVIDEKLPERIRNTYAAFAETRVYGQGDKPVFTVKTGKARARQFVTRVALAGIYETFKLDKTSFSVETNAYGGAAEIGFEEFLDGRVDFNELTEIIMQGLEDAVYAEITKAMTSVVDSLQASNKLIEASFNAANFDKLLNVARVDGDVTILTSLEIASLLVPADKWISDADRTEVRNQGYVAKYKGANVVILPQYFLDLEKTEYGVDPSFAWLLPAGALNEKPVKVAFEGDTQVREREGADWSKEIQVYKKFGAAVINTNSFCVYQATDLV